MMIMIVIIVIIVIIVLILIVLLLLLMIMIMTIRSIAMSAGKITCAAEAQCGERPGGDLKKSDRKSRPREGGTEDASRAPLAAVVRTASRSVESQRTL